MCVNVSCVSLAARVCGVYALCVCVIDDRVQADAYLCVCLHARVFVCVCVSACVFAHVCVFHLLARRQDELAAGVVLRYVGAEATHRTAYAGVTMGGYGVRMG